MANQAYERGDAICKRCGEPLEESKMWVHRGFGAIRIAPGTTRTFHNGYDHFPEPARTGDKS